MGTRCAGSADHTVAMSPDSEPRWNVQASFGLGPFRSSGGVANVPRACACALSYGPCCGRRAFRPVALRSLSSLRVLSCHRDQFGHRCWCELRRMCQPRRLS
jgi:hypothetical protein